MSKQIHDESQRRKQVKFRAAESLIDEFDALVDTSDEYDNRADALRSAMRRALGDADESDAPREPPADETLRSAYLALVSMANHRGVVPHDIAVAELSTQLARSQDIINRRVLGKLRKRGYLRQLVGERLVDRAWQVRGMEDTPHPDAGGGSGG
ncbi:hypothetical protein [Halovenus marina]|uniref:hypothetical protein n=1 Tax=Halovenus marina TaxID=3396621 RepID=UPI003F559109